MKLLWTVLIILAASSARLVAFDGAGHMLVADIAWAALAGAVATRGAISLVLKKARGQFKAAGSDPAALHDSFVRAATFPDVIKTNPGTEYEPMIARMNLLFWSASEAKKAGNEGRRCKSWHYYDTPLFVPARTTPVLPSSNFIVAHREGVRRLTQLNRGDYDGPVFDGLTKDDLKFWWLAWLLHLTGDAHQPLHCASSYSVPGNVGKPDAGGNLFKLAGGQKLHGYWDGALEAAAADDGFAISGAPTSSKPGEILGVVTTRWQKDIRVTIGNCDNLDAASWIAEGADFAKQIAYQGVQPNTTPSSAYRLRTRKHSRQAALLAGCRLSKVLQGIFAS